jgi:hypothetical protein
MGLKEADREKKGLRQGTQCLNGGWCNNTGLKTFYISNKIVADAASIFRDVFLAYQGRIVADIAQRVQNVLAVIVEREAAMSQAERLHVMRYQP